MYKDLLRLPFEGAIQMLVSAKRGSATNSLDTVHRKFSRVSNKQLQNLVLYYGSQRHHPGNSGIMHHVLRIPSVLIQAIDLSLKDLPTSHQGRITNVQRERTSVVPPTECRRSARKHSDFFIPPKAIRSQLLRHLRMNGDIGCPLIAMQTQRRRHRHEIMMKSPNTHTCPPNQSSNPSTG